MSSKFREATKKFRQRARFDTIALAAGTLTNATLAALPFFVVPLETAGSGFTAAKTYSETNVSTSKFQQDETFAVQKIIVAVFSDDPDAATGDAAGDFARFMGCRPRLTYTDNDDQARVENIAPIDCIEMSSQSTRDDVGAIAQRPGLLGITSVPVEGMIDGALKPSFSLALGADATATLSGKLYVRLFLVGGALKNA